MARIARRGWSSGTTSSSVVMTMNPACRSSSPRIAPTSRVARLAQYRFTRAARVSCGRLSVSLRRGVFQQPARQLLSELAGVRGLTIALIVLLCVVFFGLTAYSVHADNQGQLESCRLESPTKDQRTSSQSRYPSVMTPGISRARARRLSRRLAIPRSLRGGLAVGSMRDRQMRRRSWNGVTVWQGTLRGSDSRPHAIHNRGRAGEMLRLPHSSRQSPSTLTQRSVM